MSVENQYIGAQKHRDAIFIDGAGAEYSRTPKIATENRKGNRRLQVPAGTVIGKDSFNSIWRPLKKDSAQSAVSNANEIEVANVDQFVVGDEVELPDSVAKGADRFRQITAIDENNNKITVDGAAFSLSQGDTIEVDPTRQKDSVQDAGTTTNNVVTVNDASKFAVGDLLDIGPATASFTLSLPDGTYSGTVSVSVSIFDGDGNHLLDLDAEVDASSATEDTIMSELQSQLDDQLSNADIGNLGSVSTAAGPPATLTVSLADSNHEFSYTWSDNEISGSISASEDDSTDVEVTGVDENNDQLTLAKTLTFSNGEAIFTQPGTEYIVTDRTVSIDLQSHVPQNVFTSGRTRGKVKLNRLIGLTDHAKEQLKPQIEFRDFPVGS